MARLLPLGAGRVDLSDVADQTALRLGRLFGTSAEFWIGLQAAYELETARRTVGETINAEVRPRAA